MQLVTHCWKQNPNLQRIILAIIDYNMGTESKNEHEAWPASQGVWIWQEKTVIKGGEGQMRDCLSVNA